MKRKLLILLLLFFSNLNAQSNFDTAKLKNNSIDVENRFILPVYKNQIIDSEKFFSENEIQLLHNSIDSIFRSIKLKIQVAFVTPEYYDNNTSKFNLFTDSLSNKWHTDQEEARVILIVSMSDRIAQMIMSGSKLNNSFKDQIKIMKEKRKPTKVEKENIKNLSRLTNKILFEEAMLGVNLKAKNYVKALNNFFNTLLKNSHLIFDMN